MRLVVVFGFDVSTEAQVELVEAGDAFKVQPADQLASKRSPDPFHLPLRGSVAWTAVHQMNPEPGAQQPQVIPAEAGMIVEQQLPNDAAPGDGVIENGEKALFGFTEARFHIGDQPAAIID